MHWEVASHYKSGFNVYNHFDGDWAVLVEPRENLEHMKKHRPVYYEWMVVYKDGEVARGQYYDPEESKRIAEIVYNAVKPHIKD